MSKLVFKFLSKFKKKGGVNKKGVIDKDILKKNIELKEKKIHISNQVQLKQIW